MVSITKLHNGIEEPTHGYHNYYIRQMLILSGYICQGERIFIYPAYCFGQHHSDPY